MAITLHQSEPMIVLPNLSNSKWVFLLLYTVKYHFSIFYGDEECNTSTVPIMVVAVVSFFMVNCPFQRSRFLSRTFFFVVLELTYDIVLYY